MDTKTERNISEMRAIRDGILGRGVIPEERDCVTLTFNRFSGKVPCVDTSHPSHPTPSTTERHVIVASLTATNDSVTTTSAPTVDDIVAALREFLARAEQSGATEIDLLSDVYHALSY